jgi:hypothetical protein
MSKIYSTSRTLRCDVYVASDLSTATTSSLLGKCARRLIHDITHSVQVDLLE